MNDELKLTDEQLQLATSRSLPPCAVLNAETAAARESFVALGTAVEAFASELDEAALVARLSKSCMEPADRGRIALNRVSNQRDWWPIILSSALALAALIAIARIATVSPDGVTDIAANQIADPPAQPQPHLANAGRVFAGWSDPLDDEIALAAATIGQLGGRSRGLDGSLNDMNERLDALSQELLGESL